MRLVRNPLVVLAVSIAVTASACGVAANDTAATIGGKRITVKEVDEIARDPLFSPSGGDLAKAVLPGDLARSALMFEITRAAWISEANRWGLNLDDTRQQAESELDSQLAQSQDQSSLSASLREKLIEYYAAQIALQTRFQSLDSTNSSDLRRFYDGAPGLWDRTCAWIASIPTGSEKKALSLLDSGTRLKDLPGKLDGAALVADPTQSCLSSTSMPAEMRDDVAALPIGKVSGLLSVDQGAVRQNFIAQVESRNSVSFADAHDELVRIVTSLASQGAQPWIEVLVSTAHIDPRFGLTVAASSTGEPAIVAPAAPVLSEADQRTTATAQGAAAPGESDTPATQTTQPAKNSGASRPDDAQ